jgi:hypothetical protein
MSNREWTRIKTKIDRGCAPMAGSICEVDLLARLHERIAEEITAALVAKATRQRDERRLSVP